MNFDHIIMNPPYDKNLHLKILQEAIKHSNDIVNLSPIRWLQDPLAEYKKNSDWKKFESVRSHISSLDMLTKKETDAAFGIACEPVGIYTIDGKTPVKFNHDFGKRIIEITEKFYSDYMNNKKTAFWCPVARFHWTIGGTEYFEPFTLALSENGTYAKSGWTKGLHDTYEMFYFETEDELKNFKAFLQLKSYKWILGHLLVGKRLPIDLIPMMPTYTHPWTDEMLYEYFGLTEDEIKEIEQDIK